MLKQLLLIGFIYFFGSLALLGQTLPDFTMDSIPRKSEYYTTAFSMPYGAAGYGWKLLEDQKLVFQVGSDRGSSRRYGRSTWSLSGDTLSFVIDPKIVLAYPWLTTSTYRSVILKWTGRSKWMPTLHEKPLHVETNVIFLVDPQKMQPKDFYRQLVNYVKSDFEKKVIEIDNQDKMDLIDVNQIVARLIRDFCEKEGVFYETKIYFNGNWMRHWLW
jgi:hypothetical protein